MVHVLLPYMVFPIYAVMRRIDPALLAAAEGLGAPGWQIFRRIYFPLTLPGVLAGVTLVFIVSIGFFITPALLGGGKVIMIAVLIETAGAPIPELGICGGALGRPARRHLACLPGAAPRFSQRVAMELSRRPTRPVPGWRIGLHAFCALVFLFLMAPLIVVFPISFSSSPYLQFPPPGWSLRWYVAYIEDTAWVDATLPQPEGRRRRRWCLSTALGTLLAFAVVRGRYPGKSLLNQFALLPLIVPAIVYSIAVYGLFAQLRLIGDWKAIVLGHTVHAIPFVLILVAAALRTYDENYELGRDEPRREPLEGGVARHPAANPAGADLGHVPGVHHLLRRARGRHVPRRVEHDAAEEDVRQHHQRDRSDHRGGFGAADRARHRRARLHFQGRRGAAPSGTGHG